MGVENGSGGAEGYGSRGEGVQKNGGGMGEIDILSDLLERQVS